jgi:small-conductance mechanosensitive channel
MKHLSEWLQKATGIPVELYDKLFTSLACILVLWFFRWLILKGEWRRTENALVRYQWRKISNYLTFALFFLLVGRVWLKEFESVTTFLGIVSAGLAIAMKDPLVNVAGWLFIIWRHPFKVGDRIQIGDHAGDVLEIGIFQFTIMEIGNWVHADQRTGRIVHIPNGKVFVDPQANYTKEWFEYIWNEIPVLVTFESNWKKAKKILQQIADTHSEYLIPLAERKLKESSREFIILSPSLDPAVFTSVAESGVLLTLRHLCEPWKRRESTQEYWEAILDAFAGCDDICFAYPTQRAYTNISEEKIGAGSRKQDPVKS